MDLNTAVTTLVVDNKTINIDIRKMMEDIHDTETTKDRAYFNATPVAREFGKEAREFMRRPKTIEYINILDVISKENQFNLPCKKYHGDLNPKLWGSKEKGFKLYENNIEIKATNVTCRSYTIINPSGNFTKGTYMQTELFFEFIRWLDPRFKVLIDIAFMDLLRGVNKLKKERVSTILEFHKLIAISEKHYIPYQTEGYPQEHANSKLMDLINITVLGLKASTYKNKHNISTTTPARDWLSPKQLEHIKWCEDELIGFIKYAKITDYNVLKRLLQESYVEEYGVK